jgi:hypothetical protein
LRVSGSVFEGSADTAGQSAFSSSNVFAITEVWGCGLGFRIEGAGWECGSLFKQSIRPRLQHLVGFLAPQPESPQPKTHTPQPETG